MARTTKTVYPFFFFFSSLHVLPRFACQNQDAFSKRTGSIFASCRFVLLCSVPCSTSLGLFVPYDCLGPCFEISRPYIYCLDQEKKASFPCPTGRRPGKKRKKKSCGEGGQSNQPTRGSSYVKHPHTTCTTGCDPLKLFASPDPPVEGASVEKIQLFFHSYFAIAQDPTKIINKDG